VRVEAVAGLAGLKAGGGLLQGADKPTGGDQGLVGASAGGGYHAPFGMNKEMKPGIHLART